MLQQTQNTGGFFESVAQSRAQNTPKARDNTQRVRENERIAEDIGQRVNRLRNDNGEDRFREALETVRASETSERRIPDSARAEAQRLRERRQAQSPTPQADAEANERLVFITQNELEAVERLLQNEPVVGEAAFAEQAPRLGEFAEIGEILSENLNLYGTHNTSTFDLPTTNFTLADTLNAEKVVEIENLNSQFSALNFEAVEGLGIDVKAEAIYNIEKILRNITELLNLNIGQDSPMVYLGGDGISQETVEHLAQVLATLNERAEALMQVAKDDPSLLTALPPKEPAEMGQYLHQEILALKLNLAQLGISKEVATELGKIDPTIDANLGLNIAADLGKKTAAQQILPKSINDILANAEILPEKASEIKLLVEKLKKDIEALQRQNLQVAQAKPTETGVTPETATKAPALEAIATAPEATAKTPALETVAALKKELAKETNAELKISANTEEKGTAKIADKLELSASAKAEIKENAQKASEKAQNIAQNIETKLNIGRTQTSQNANSQATQVQPQPQSVEQLSSMKEVMPKAGEINAPIAAVDGVTVEAQKFSDSSEITAVSPRFAKLFEKEIVDQVQKMLLAQAVKKLNGLREVSITLTPERLGEIKLNIKVEGNIVSAIMNVESAQVKSIIEQNLQQLKEALEKQDLSAGSLDVNVGEQTAQDLQEKMQTAKERAKNARAHRGKEETLAEASLELGADTGRRFGTNSFEYFA